MLVRNVKYALKKDHNVYIGRGNEYRKRSPLANPFYFNQRDDVARKESIDKYRVWLWDRMQSTDPAKSEPVWNALRSITPTSVLLCHCYPKPCHGQVVRKAWEWAYQQGLIPDRWSNHTSKTLDVLSDHNRREAAFAEHQKEMAAHAKQRQVEADAARMFPTKTETDARLDEEILEHYIVVQPKKRGRGKPKTRGIVYTQPDTRYNDLDHIALDLEELYAHV